MGYVAELRERVEESKRRRRAVILAHNYELPEVQDVADFVGDSLELARRAMSVDADVVVLAGVYFMAEVAAILNPDKVVLIPNPAAGCPLADFLTPEVIRRYRERYPGAPLVVYINSYARAKYYADYIVTSASAVKLVSKLDDDVILFGPDRNLASFVAERTGKRVIPVPEGGHCPVHEYLLSEYYVLKALREHPGAKLLLHPEAPPEARRHAHFVGSTSQMLKAIGELGGRRVPHRNRGGPRLQGEEAVPRQEGVPREPQGRLHRHEEEHPPTHSQGPRGHEARCQGRPRDSREG